MPVAFDRFAAEGFASCERFRRDRAYAGTSVVECTGCGYEPPDGIAPDRCPRCLGSAWDRYIRPGLVVGAQKPRVRRRRTSTDTRTRGR